MESVITAPSIQFKGSGWYVNDYGGKKSGSDGEKSEKPVETKEATSKEKDSAAKDAATKESASKESKDKKPAKKK
jgi:predicted nucleic acid-binding Zn ribbon protein